MRSDRLSNDDGRVPDPSILTPPAGQSRDLQGTTKLEYRLSDDGSRTRGTWEVVPTSPLAVIGHTSLKQGERRTGSVGCPCLGYRLCHRIGGRTQT